MPPDDDEEEEGAVAKEEGNKELNGKENGAGNVNGHS